MLNEIKKMPEVITLSISCVTYASEPLTLRDTLSSLSNACASACKNGLNIKVLLYLIDNGPNDDNLNVLKHLRFEFASYFDEVKLITGQGNVGYGGGHNLAINQSQSDYHLIINPDVIVDEHNILIALIYLITHKDVGLLAPDALYPNGLRQYIAKRNPEVIVLLARALNIIPAQGWLREKMGLYEYRDRIPAIAPFEIELASGCYMFCRTSVLQAVNGFDARYFMYFEDFDLSARISKIANIIHHPELKIVHSGGGASLKGIRHIRYFICSFLRYKLSRILNRNWFFS